MCADCHSTGLRKNYDAAADQFATTWSEISVGCEACHGPGSAHVAWANASRESKAYADASKGPRGPPRRAARRDMGAGARRARRRRARHRAPASARSKCARSAMPDAGSSPMGTQRARPFSTTTDRRYSPRRFITPTASSATKSMNGARFCRARCTRPELPAAIVTSRTAARCGRRATPYARSATQRTRLMPARITITDPAARERSALTATCPAQSTWALTLAMITACACRVPTSLCSLARRMPAMPVMPTTTRAGPRRK